MSADAPNDESLDRLIELATQLGSAGPPPHQPSRRRIVSILIAVALVAGGVAGAIAWRSHDTKSADQQRTAGAVATSTSTPTTASVTVGSGPLAAATTKTTISSVASLTTPDSSSPLTVPGTSVSPTGTTLPPADGVIRWAEFSDGRVYLRGRVPSQAIADEIRAKAAAAVGDANVVVQYEIVPGTPLPKSAPLYIRNSILFPAGGFQLSADARSVLDLGVLLFKQNPQMSVVVSGYTDATGSTSGNLKLSQRRVDAIVNYFTSRGVPASHVSGKAMGEADSVGDNSTEEGRAKNRRVELQVINLIG